MHYLEMLQCKAKHEKRDRVNLSLTLVRAFCSEKLQLFEAFHLYSFSAVASPWSFHCNNRRTKLAHMSDLALWSYSSLSV